MTELGEIFAELGISQYLNDFIEQGFDTWETILDIKESDFDALNVKLGHRRKIQRKIASSRGLSSDRALESPGYTGGDGGEEQKAGGVKSDGKEAVAGSGTQGAKRKYRRHPKTDENAPERPPSAYVIFSNKMREDLKGRNLSFTEIAKLVGEHWQNLAPHDKEPFETQASNAKEKYLGELAEYKKTESYREYTQYLAEFKARQQNQQSVNDLDPAKRPKLEAQPSTTSTGTTSSGASQHGIDTPPSNRETSLNSTPWLAKDRHNSPQSIGLSTLARGLGSSKVVDSSVVTSPILPGYRESLYGSTHHSLPWRDTPRDEGATILQPTRMRSAGDRHSSSAGSMQGSPNNFSGILQPQVSPQQHPPPLMKSESTNSTSSSVYFTPRTPLDAPLERGVSLPPIYAQKSNGPFDHQLPPLRPPSHSPQNAIPGSMQSPSGNRPGADFPPPMAGMRGYGHPQPPHVEPRHEYSSPHSGEEALDPVSALLRAGEIVNRNSRNLP